MAHPAVPHPAPRVPRRAHAGAVAVPPEEVPGDPGSLLRDALAFVGEHRARLARLGLHSPERDVAGLPGRPPSPGTLRGG